MIRIVLGVIGGFFAWALVWFGIEKLLIAVLPAWFGAPQLAFQNAVENGGGQFTAETRLLLSHIVIGSIVSAIAGYLSALIAGENKRAPMALGVLLLLAIGVVKVIMAWQYVPVWYHILFTALLLPSTIFGGKLKTTS